MEVNMPKYKYKPSEEPFKCPRCANAKPQPIQSGTIGLVYTEEFFCHECDFVYTVHYTMTFSHWVDETKEEKQEVDDETVEGS
jgi:transposase-like protein